MTRGITENDVHDAADNLVAEGERPTVERIRAHLGTGSPNTVTRHLDSWWSGLGGRLAAHRRGASLPDMPEEVSELASRWWDAALSRARAALVGEWDAAETALAKERDALHGASVSMAAEVEEARQTAELAERMRQRLEQREADLTTLVAQLQGRADELEAQRDASESRVILLQEELSQQRRQADHQELEGAAERKRLAENFRVAEDRAQMEIDRARQEAVCLSKELHASQRGATTLAETHRREIHVVRAELARAELSVAVARAEAATAREALMHRKRPAAAPKATAQPSAPSSASKPKSSRPKTPRPRIRRG